MSEREIRAAIRSICNDLDLRARGPSVASALLGAGLAAVVACEGTTETRPTLPNGGAGSGAQGGAGGMDAGPGAGFGPADAGGTDPGASDAYGAPFPEAGYGGFGGTAGSGGIGGSGGAGGAAGG